MNKTAYHPNGHHVVTFEEARHIYKDNTGMHYISGTTFIGQFFPRFDAMAVSKKCAEGTNPKYAERSPEDIRAEWAAEAKRGQEEGTNVHEYAEGLMCGWPVDRLPKPISERCAAIFIQVKKAVDGLLQRFEFIGTEVIVFSPTLRIAGMIDLLMFDRAVGDLLILDYKQNKDRPSTVNHFQNAFPPIEHLQDTGISHYSLQLSLYQFIMQRENYFPEITGYRRALIHLRPGSFELIPIEYYGYEIGRIFEL